MSDIETITKNCENWVNNHKGENFLLTYSSVLELLAALKERETNPIEPVEETVNDILLWHCGKCGFYLGPNDNFCSNCGRSVKWNEID